MERLQRERDLAKGDVERLVEERDALRERLKVKFLLISKTKITASCFNT